MFPLFTNPLALWGLLALPLLVAIYWLRQRHRRHPVSSLMLWLESRESRQGGTRIDRLRTPLLFFLELLALALLALAAAEPRLPLRESVRPLIVVLDDSFSMQAGGALSSRDQAVQALEEELKYHPRPSVRFLLAGDGTQALGEAAHTTPEALDRLSGWHCMSATSRLEETLSFAAELGGELPLLLVLTDHAPSHELHKGRVQWWAFGRARPNVAIVSAVRTPHEGGERCLLEIANYSEEAGEASLVVETGDPAAEIQRSVFLIDPRQAKRVIVPLPEGTPILRARLGEDDLLIDNHVSLLSSMPRPARTKVRIEDRTLRELIDKALRATRNATPVETQPDILFTDREDQPEDADESWIVHVLAEKDGAAFTGPFVLDRNHPLTEGLSLQGVVWGGGKSTTLFGSPVILAGDVPLLSDTAMRTDAHELRLRLRPDLSTLQDCPGWPILIANLLRWRAANKPGLERNNLRLGEKAVLSFAQPRGPVAVVRPDGQPQVLSVQDRRLVVRANQIGVWTIDVDDESRSFAVNALSAEESDLTGCASGRWGDWLDETSLRLEYQSVGWMLLLLVLAVVAVHLLLVARGRGRT